MAKPILLVIFAAVIFWSTATLLAQEQVPAPVHKDGDTWQFNISRKGQFAAAGPTVYNDGMYELSVSQGAVNIYELNDSEKIVVHPRSRWELLRLLKTNNQRPDLKFPLSVGQKWTYQGFTSSSVVRLASPTTRRYSFR